MSLECAVIGNPIEHSLSPQIHQHFAAQCGIDLVYRKILGDLHLFEKQVEDFFAQGGKGLNVTLPFKERAFNLAKQATTRCRLAKAANTLWMVDGQLHADNTDGAGLLTDLKRFLPLENLGILILGAGGAARGIIGPLLETNPRLLMVANRTKDKAPAIKKDFPQIKSGGLDDIDGHFDLIINATSSGLHDQSLDLNPELFANKPFCYDLAYNQVEPTPFVRFSRLNGCKAVDGLGMLVGQAAEAFFVWHGVRPGKA